MTVLAGVYSRSAKTRLTPDLSPAILQAIGQHEGNHVEKWSNARYFIARLDIGAYEVAATAQSDGALTAIVGDPVLSQNSSRQFANRGLDAQHIHRQLLQDDFGTLRNANGTFAGVHVSEHRDELCLFTDRVGVRQLFVAEAGELIFFASRLETLRDLECIPKQLDVRSLIEESTLHFSMDRRTPFKGVSLLQAGEFLRIRDHSVEPQYYWSWKSVEPVDVPLDTQLAELHARFSAAIRMRMTDDRQYSFLSGGMDSRCIVGGLVQ
ncbi:MAG: hypothetical protein HKN70_13305, partial [Gammaproteobacteria bacterium]|nr:hypothetical protein [Gammaproteobacteria bacterium]